MTREELLQNIDRMTIYEKDYLTLKRLIDLNDDKLFVKILEEVFEGNMIISDLERNIPTEGYTNLLTQLIERNIALKSEREKLDQIRRINSKERLSLQLGESSLYDEERKNLIDDYRYNLAGLKESLTFDDEETRKKFVDFIESPEGEDIFLAMNTFSVPLSFDYQILLNSDVNYMLEHNLTTDQMKKLKALSNIIKYKERE